MAKSRIKTYMVLKFIKDFPGLLPAERYLALIIATYWAPNTETFVSLKTLCTDTGYKERHLSNLKKALKIKKIFRMINRYKGGSKAHEATRFEVDEDDVWNYWRSKYGDTAFQDSTPPHSSAEPSRTPVQAKKPPKKKANSKPSDYTEDFLTFWEAYPRKDGKRKAFASWLTINPNPEQLNTILAAVEAHKQTDQWSNNNGRYIPYAATWLNEGRWEDEIQVKKQSEPYRGIAFIN